MQNTNKVRCFKVHGKVDGILIPFVITNPSNLVFNEAKVQGELEDAAGNKLMVTRTMITFQNGMKLVVEETVEELIELFEGLEGVE